jgi:hypothetical protein
VGRGKGEESGEGWETEGGGRGQEVVEVREAGEHPSEQSRASVRSAEHTDRRV